MNSENNSHSKQRKIEKLSLNIFIYILFSLASGSFIILTFQYFHLPPQTNSEGFNNFLEIFKFPISTFAAFVTMLVIKLTLKRIDQTEKSLEHAQGQIQLIDENNRFNNYFIHYQQFKIEFQNFKLFEEIKLYNDIEGKNKKIDPDYKTFIDESHILNKSKFFHGYLYTRFPKKFEPTFNVLVQNTISILEEYLEEINRIILDEKLGSVNNRLMSIEMDQLRQVISKFNEEFTSIAQRFALIEQDYYLAKTDKELDPKLYELFVLFWQCKILNEFLTLQDHPSIEIYNYIHHFRWFKIINKSNFINF